MTLLSTLMRGIFIQTGRPAGSCAVVAGAAGSTATPRLGPVAATARLAPARARVVWVGSAARTRVGQGHRVDRLQGMGLLHARQTTTARRQPGTCQVLAWRRGSAAVGVEQPGASRDYAASGADALI